MRKLDSKEGRAPKNGCFQTVVLEKRVLWKARRSNQSILKKINPENSGMTDDEAETPILWPPDVNS